MNYVLGLSAFVLCCAVATPANAGPPFLTDDPDPTPHHEFEIYLFNSGAFARHDLSGDIGIDFNYGAGADLQLTATLPLSFDRPDGGPTASGLGNIELAAKYRFLHQETSGWNAAFFPRVFLPSPSTQGDDHAALLLPVWFGKAGESWSTFGGGGCAINRGGDSQDFCLAGWAVTHRLNDNLQFGAELFHQSADTKDGFTSTTLGAGATYDLDEHVHLLGYAGAGLQNTAETGRASWYASVLFTF